MALVKAICPEDGDILFVEEGQDFVICKYCGQKFTIENTNDSNFNIINIFDNDTTNPDSSKV